MNIESQPSAEPSAMARAFLAEPHPLLIDGEWCASSEGGEIPVIDPATGQRISSASLAGPDDCDRAVAAAKRAFPKWRDMPAKLRAARLRAFADIIRRNGRLLGEIETINNGMPIAVATNVVPHMLADALEYFAGYADKIAGETNGGFDRVASHPGEGLAFTLRQPVGVVAAIVPWNFPCGFFVMKIAPALAAGCTVVIKPSEITPLTANLLGRWAIEAGIPAGVLNIVPGDIRAGQRLTEHPDVAKISFTGSTAVGREIARSAATTFKRLTLELGGKSPFVVFEDADIAAAAAAAFATGTQMAGQYCMAPTRIYVHANIHDAFVTALRDRLLAARIGPGLDPANQIGPLISAAHRDRVMRTLAGARAAGFTVEGGEPIEPGFFLSPALIFGAQPGSDVAQIEIFGAALCIFPFEDTDLDAVAALANASEYGLAASVWTRDIGRALGMTKRFDAGTIGINCHGVISPQLPFGGTKHSGQGRENGGEGLDAFLETKTVVMLA